MPSYTEQMENRLYSSWQDLDHQAENYDAVISFLNSPSFRCFGEGLSALITRKMETDCADTPITYLKKRQTAYGIRIASDNTLRDWFSGAKRPKKGVDSRQKMFQLAFVLDLSVEETSWLFHHVYLDRAFYPRNAEELIYYHCLSQKKPFQDAAAMIAKVIHSDCSGCEDATMMTSVLQAGALQTKDDVELLAYINSHPHNFDISNRSANQICDETLTRAGEIVICEAEKRYHRPHNGQTDRSSEWYELFKGSDITSVNTIYQVITEQYFNPDSQVKKREITFLSDEFTRDIQTGFPQPSNISSNKKTSDELRKQIILFASYVLWFQIQDDKKEMDIEEYMDSINLLLFDAGLPELYYGNPHDWMYLYCTYIEPAYPLDTFRGLLQNIIQVKQTQ